MRENPLGIMLCNVEAEYELEPMKPASIAKPIIQV